MIDKYFTPLGYKRLSDEREWLVKLERPAVTAVVSWAASLGDRSENADYQYSKRRLREIDKRLQFLASRLDGAIIINPEQIQSDKIQFSATVEIEDEDGDVKTFSIVGTDEVDTNKGYISYKSPIGSALLGKKVGDSVTARTPQGDREFQIVSIEYRKIEIEEFKGESSVSGFNR